MTPRSISFCFFSGTGNTLLVVRRMAEVFRAAGVTVTLRRLEAAVPSTIRLEDTLGLAFPVAEFSTYTFVWRFIEGLPQAAGTPVFMVDTMGGFSGTLVGPLKGLLQSKGYVPLAAREIVMPGNYLWIPGPEKAQRMIAKGLQHAERYAGDILSGKARWRRFSPLPYGLVKWLRRFPDRGMAQAGRKLRVAADKCTRCGLCVKLCPVHNIERPELPRFLDHCEQCQRCLAFCPTRAISAPARSHGSYRAVTAAEILEN